MKKLLSPNTYTLILDLKYEKKNYKTYNITILFYNREQISSKSNSERNYGITR